MNTKIEANKWKALKQFTGEFARYLYMHRFCLQQEKSEKLARAKTKNPKNIFLTSSRVFSTARLCLAWTIFGSITWCWLKLIESGKTKVKMERWEIVIHFNCNLKRIMNWTETLWSFTSFFYDSKNEEKLNPISSASALESFFKIIKIKT